jgi:probable phosphoglycerate mutase
MSSVLTTSDPALLPQLRIPAPTIFIRHGQTDWNFEGRMQGRRDIPLNATGEGQAAANGARLKTFLTAEGIDPGTLDFVSSPLGRTRTTMELLRGAMGLEPDSYRLEDRIKEITFGDWEGFTLEELADEEQERLLQRRADKWSFVPPGGESYEMLSERIAAWLSSLDRPAVVVSHGGVFRAVRGLLEGRDKASVPRIDVPQDKVFVWRDGQFTTV